MKTLSIILGVLLLIETTALLVSHRYEFHTDTVGGDGYKMPTMWRCDRLTGKVVVSTFVNQQWMEVKEPFVAPVFDQTKPYTVESTNDGPWNDFKKPKLTAEQYLDATNKVSDSAK